MTKYFYAIVVVLSVVGIVAIVNISNLLKEEPTYNSVSEQGDDIDFEITRGSDAFSENQGDENLDIIKPVFEVMIDDEGIDLSVKYYRLVAGSFGSEANAQKMLQKIKDLGYKEAEIIKDNEQKLSRVIVAEFNDMDLAQMVKEKIESSHGIDIYMKTVSP